MLTCGGAFAAGEHADDTNSIGIRLVYFPPGEYVRGAIHGDQLRKNHPFSTGGTGSHDARPAHRVKLARPFRIGATEVTVGQFRKFVEATGYKTTAESDGRGALAFYLTAEKGLDQFALNGECTWRNPGFEQTDDHPVVCVSWKDTMAFCKWLSEKEGITYRLPTEAEWEYAARAGSTTSYIGGDSADTIYAFGNVADAALEAAHPGMTLRQRIARLGKGEGDGFVYTAPVASLKSNRRGLFDTHGNVWEWCSDRFHPRYYSELTGASVMNSDPLRLPVVVDPNGPETTIHHKYGDWRAVRGGAWCTGPLTSRSAERSFAEATDAFVYTGFRVVAEKTLKE
ncbi:MAG TPA: formylglycine-generating enzyme family protein [Planctomycetes bacterium]|nr:formylglycine-generating enzyme family protein [Planctomycetota bacterium]